MATEDIYKVDPNKDTSIYIFDYLFHIRVRKIEITSIAYSKVFGSHITGNAGIDRELQNEWLDYHASIDTMVEHYKKGITIKVVKYSDSKIIYDFITAHLKAWKVKLGQGLNIGTAPLEDLIKMDELAGMIYEHAKSQFIYEEMSSELATALSGIAGFNKFNLFNKSITEKMFKDNDGTANNGVKINSSESDKFPTRAPMADLFIKNMIRS